jgi:hypothetical protein
MEVLTLSIVMAWTSLRRQRRGAKESENEEVGKALPLRDAARVSAADDDRSVRCPRAGVGEYSNWAGLS